MWGSRTRNRLRRGIYLTRDYQGTLLYSDEVTVGRYGAQRGQVVAIKDLDDKGRSDFDRRTRPEDQVTGLRGGAERQIWRWLDENGILVVGTRDYGLVSDSVGSSVDYGRIDEPVGSGVDDRTIPGAQKP